MDKENELWMAKDKHGHFWLGTLSTTKEDVESNFRNSIDRYKLKIVKVKLVEVE